MACTNYLTITKPNSCEPIKVPCGRCMACRIANRESWIHRIEDECSYYGTDCSFVTLTYSDDFLRLVVDGDTNLLSEGHIRFYPTLDKVDVQRFLKRLRYYRNYENPIRAKLSYMCVGEYGGILGRPHYHLIICGIDPVLDLHLLNKSWTYGIVDAQVVNHARIRYVLKYMDKQLFTQEDKVRTYEQAQPPFRLMSKSIGARFLEEHIDELSRGEYYRKGKRVAIPRYYSDANTVYGSLSIKRYSEKEAFNFKKYVKGLSELDGSRDMYRFLERKTALKIAEYEFKENNKAKGV